MSLSGTIFAVESEDLLKSKLKVFYSFERKHIPNPFNFLKNIYPASPLGTCDAFIVSNTGSSFFNDYLNQNTFLANDGSGNLNTTNLAISGVKNFNLNDCAMVFQFSKKNYKNPSVILGCFEKIQETVNGQIYTSSNGFNFGINSRGKMFFQSLGIDGEYVLTANSIELSEKNTISLSISAGQLEITRFDYLNNDIQSDLFSINENYLKNQTGINKFIIGGSPNFYSSNGFSGKTFDGTINNLAIFSGYVPKSLLKTFSESFVSEYFYNSGLVSTSGYITGYSQTVNFFTGITGYFTGIIGTKNVLTGLAYSTGSSLIGSSFSSGEGTRISNSYNNPSGLFFYKEEFGLLNPSNFGKYIPTGNSGFDTLGLSGNASGNNYSFSSGMYSGFQSFPVYGVSGLTGFTKEVSGYTQTPLYEQRSTTGQASSGILLSGSSTEYMKDYIYYLGDRERIKL